MLPNKSSSNNIMLDPAGQSMSGGPQPLLSTPIQPPNSNSFNKTQRRPKMDNQSSNPKSSSHHHKGSSGSHQSHHHPSHLQQSESKFYTMASIELKDPLEITLEDSYNKLKYLISPSDQQQKPDSMSFNELSNYSNQSKQHYDEVCNALLYSILTDPSNAQKCLRNLFLCNNLSFNQGNNGNVNSESNANQSSSSYAILINNLRSIITENYSRLQDVPRQQLVWLLRELVKARVNQCESLMLQMLRNIQSGSLAEKNYWLAESLLDILSEPATSSLVSNGSDANKQQGSLWIYSNTELLTQTIYTYLRIIADHSQAVALNQLRQRESEFCIQVLRERWMECMSIGRDLVRLLQNLAKLPEFEQLWKDIIYSPQMLSPRFAQDGGLCHLMRLPTRRRCLISRLTIDMERKVYFIITSVKNGQQKRYLEWFQRQYLNTAESQTLRADLMRYICVVVHPTNEQLNAGLVPRWSICGWLINSCTNQIEAANLKLALFFDWLMYDAKKDNIMLIEPAILLMYNACRPPGGFNTASVSLTNQLFDFLCRISTNYHWPIKDQILNGIMHSFKDVIEKRVIGSIQTFFTESQNPKFPQPSVLDRELKNLIQATFGTFFQTLGAPAVPQQPVAPIPSVQSQSPMPLMTTSPRPSLSALNSESNATSSFSSFKRQIKSEPSTGEADSAVGSVSPSNSFSSIESSEGSSFKSYFSSLKNADNSAQMDVDRPATNIKSEPSNTDLAFKLETSAQFSDDDDSSNEPTEKSNLGKSKWEIASTVAASPSYLMLQKQLQKFSIKPTKVFCIDESSANSVLAGNSHQNQIENHLNLIQSDDLRDKISDFNDKVRESFASEDQPMSNYLHVMFRDILNMVQRDPEFSNNFTSSLSDVAITMCLVLKNDFTNQLLPAQFYSLGSSNGTNFKSSKLNLNTSDIDSGSSQTTQVVNVFNPNAYTLDLISESINQRVIFVLFKELSMTQNQSAERETYIQLLHEIYQKQNRIGYYFLFYIYYVSLRLNADKQPSNGSTGTNNHNSSNATSTPFNKSPTTEVLTLIKIYCEFTKDRQTEIRTELKSKQQSDQHTQSSSDENDNSDNDSNESSGHESVSHDSSSDASFSATESDTDDASGGVIEENDLVLGECYMQDLRLCQQDDPHLFCFLLPFVYGRYLMPNFMCNNSELVYLICSCIDTRQLKDLIASVSSYELALVKQFGLSNTNTGGKSTRANNAVQNSSGNKKKAGLTKYSAQNEEEKTQNKKRKRTNSNGSSKNDEVTKRNKLASGNKGKKSSKRSGHAKAKKTGKNSLSKKHTLYNVLEASLLWESVEQLFFWQLVEAHSEIDVNDLLPLLDKLDAAQHAEAVLNLFQMLKMTEPTFDVVKFICKRRVDENMERALFVHWTRKISSGETKLSQIFCKLLNRSAAQQQSQHATTLKKINLHSFNNNKKLTAEQQLEIANQQKSSRSASKLSNPKFTNNNNSTQADISKDQLPTLDQVLFYLNRLRLNNDCINFILKENMLEALQKVYKKHCDDETKKKYSDLFTLADEFEGEDQNDSDENDSDDSENNSDNDSESEAKTRKTALAKNKAKPRLGKATGKQSGNKRVIRVPSSKLPHKKPKLRNQNSSDSDKDTDQKRGDSNSTDDSASENDEDNSDSDSSAENKSYKNSRKK